MKRASYRARRDVRTRASSSVPGAIAGTQRRADQLAKTGRGVREFSAVRDDDLQVGPRAENCLICHKLGPNVAR